MRIQYVMVFFILTEARKTKTKKSEPEDEITVPPDARYYKVPFGTITLEGFNPLANGPLEYENLDFHFFKSLTSTDPPDVAPFVPNNEDNSKAKRRNWKRSKKIKKKRDQGSRAFVMSPGRAMHSPQIGDELPEGPDDNDRTQPKTNNQNLKTPKGDIQKTNIDLAGMYLDFTRNFMSSVGQRYKEGKSFAHGSRPDQAIATEPEPTEIPQNVAEHRYYTERRNSDLPRYPPYSYVPSYQRNRFVDDKNLNWTMCEEFGRDAEFYPKDIINIEWVPFFVWSNTPAMIDSIVHTFEYPTVKLVQKYKKEASPMLEKKLDWEAPKLLMKLKIVDSNNDMLIIAADRKGKFDGLRYMEMPEGVKDLKYAMPYPVLSLHLKSIGSYLAMMYCEEQYAVIMAPTGTEPTSFDAAMRGAAFLKFNGTGYVVRRNLLKEQMLMEASRMNIPARTKAPEESQTRIPPGPRDSFFPFNREPPLDML